MSDMIRRAMNHLTICNEFFAALLFEMRLKAVDDPPALLADVGQKDSSVKFTLATDGKVVYYSPRFLDSLTVPIAAFGLAHEVCHPMLAHFDRIYHHHLSHTLVDQHGKPLNPTGWVPKQDSHGRTVRRDPRLWNAAGDYVINLMLKDSGFHIWPECLCDEKYRGMTTEQVYDKLLDDAVKNGAQLVYTPDGVCGYDLAEPPLDYDSKAEAEEWKDRIVRAAAIAKQRGHLPACIEDLVREITEPQYPVWLLLEAYVDQTLRDDDYSWRRPNPYFLPQDIILPGLYSERVAHVVLVYDTSGSVPTEDLAKFHRIGGDIIRNANPAKLTIIECDADVHQVTEINSSVDWPSEIRITGRGGTRFEPAFEHVAEHQLNPTLLIYLTDLEGSFPTDLPPYPVLWVSTTPHEAPFGQTIHMNERS